MVFKATYFNDQFFSVRKHYRFYGQFTDLESYANDHKIRFDVILSKPHSRALSPAYQTPLRLLTSLKMLKVEDDRLSKYAKQILNNLFDI